MPRGEEKPRLEPGLRRKAATLGSALALIALVVGSLFGDRGILHLVAQRERTDALRREIVDLRGRNAVLAEEIRALKTDPRAIERLARESLGLARTGEKVFLIAEPKETPGR